MTTPTPLPDNRPLCVVTGHPCGSDTVRVGTDCPSTSGRCVHKSQSSFTQQNMTTPTPRTDAAICRYTGGECVTFPAGLAYVVPYRFAQELERDIGALKEQLALAHDAINDALPWMIKLGDYIGNGTQADPMGRCKAILKMRIAVEKRDD